MTDYQRRIMTDGRTTDAGKYQYSPREFEARYLVPISLYGHTLKSESFSALWLIAVIFSLDAPCILYSVVSFGPHNGSHRYPAFLTAVQFM